MMKIGVFDSGIGGKSVADALKRAFKNHEILFRNDSEHVPYGTKAIGEIYALSLPIIKTLESEGCEIIVIACNTLTTNCITDLRNEINVPLVGIEPMIKPACLATKTGVISVCATPRTLQSKRYQVLKQQYAQDVTVLEPDCSDWASLIEQNKLSEDKIRAIVEESIELGADQIVLGCTHYHWIEQQIKTASKGRATILQPETAIARRVETLIKDLRR